MRTKSSARPGRGRRRRRQPPGASTPTPTSPSPPPVANRTQAGTSSCGNDEAVVVPDTYDDVEGKEQSTDKELDAGVEKVVPLETSQGRRPPEDLCPESGGDHALDKISCLECNGVGELLVCSEDICPIVIHAKCLNCEPRFDESGRFNCPYCIYKRMAVKVEKLKRKAMLAEKKLNNFLNPGKHEEGGKKLEGERPEASNSHVCHSSQDKSNNNSNRAANNDETFQRSEPMHRLPEKTTSSEDLSAGRQSKTWKSKPLAGPTIASSLPGDSSREQNDVGNTRNQTTEGTAGPPVVAPRIMPPPLSALPSEERSSPQRISSWKLVKRDSSGNYPRKQKEASLPNGKRKRLYWRTEEEDMLKEAVRYFSSNINKNLPWRKILEYGHHVFDETRTPSDLKDKWKTMTRSRR